MLDINAKPGKPLIAASILSADFGRIAEDSADVLNKGADCLHVDVMDGHFVSNLSMGPDMCKGLRKNIPDTFLDVHLMVERPDLFVEPFAKAGAHLLSFHLEVTLPVHPAGLDGDALIEQIRGAGLKVGTVVNPYTPIEPMEPYLDRLDLVLVMSVVPGRSGQAFMPEVLSKTRWLRERVGPQTRIEMDGGVNPDTAPQAVEAGADMLVTASALFGADPSERAGVIQAMKG